MRRERDNDQRQAARLLFVYASEDERRSAIDRLPDEVLAVGRMEIASAVGAELERRDEEARPATEAIGERLKALRSMRQDTQIALEGLVADQRHLLEAAEWCNGQADADAQDTASIETASRSLEELSGEVRAARKRLDAVLEQRAAAEAALEEARAELSSLRAAGDEDASALLESQITTVERQLASAEKSARTELEDVARDLSRTELALERLRQGARDRRVRLEQFASLTSVGATTHDDPDDAVDPVASAAVLARSLLGIAEEMEPDISATRQRLEGARREAVELETSLAEQLEAAGVPQPFDTVRALECLARDRLALALDDVVRAGPGTGAEGTVGRHELLDVVTATPLIVLTADTEVLSWAIELPADRAAITSVNGLDDIGDRLRHPPTCTPTMEQRTC